MLRLRRLKINEFRAVKPGTELVFHDGFNVLLGRNGTGKTTLLELISMALRFDFSSIRDEDFDIEVEAHEILESTSNSVVMRVGTRIDDTGIAARVPDQRQRIPWVEASIRVGSKTYRYEEDGASWRLLEGEATVATGSLRGAWGQMLLGWACLTIVALDKEPIRAALPLWGSIGRGSACAICHDESLDTFDEHVLSKLEIHVLLSCSGNRHGMLVDSLPWSPVLIFAPANLAEQVRQHAMTTPSAAVLTFSSDTLSFLDQFVRLCGFESARLELSLLGRSDTPEDFGDYARVRFGRPRFLFTRKGGKATIGHELLSYGQKRLLSLLYYLEASPHHLVADEMVNGLHHEWIEEIMQRIGGRQTFLSSQNPLLLDDMEFDSADEVSRSFVLCELDELDRLVWRNMSAEEAASFYSAYEVGIQHVGEILRTQCLW
jgi:ABC-type branched-subunit amino acid transport system ATPase component